MSFSPALRHRQKMLARASGTAGSPKAALASPSPETAAGQEYAALKVLLHDNLRALSDIESHELRVPKKAEFAVAFAAWIDGVIEADQPVQDEILVTNMVWAIDYRDLGYAIRLARFALAHGLSMPDRYNRTVACFLAEEVAELAISSPEAVTHEQLCDVLQLTAEADMPDPAKAKLFKALGRSWAARAASFDPAADNAPAGGARAYAGEALDMFNRALSLDGKCGVKADIKAVEKLLKGLEPSPQS